MKKMLLSYLIMMCLVELGKPAKKLQIYWLNNGGHISGWWSDTIQISMTSAALKGQIYCPSSGGYSFQPGTTRRFSDLWFAAGGAINIGVTAKNFILPNAGVSVNTMESELQNGYYSASMTLAQMSEKTIITLSYEGLSLSIQTYRKPADYYILVYVGGQTANDTYSIDQGCKYGFQLNYLVAAYLILAFIALTIY